MAPNLQQSFAVFLRIGLLSFGGPAAQIALMHRMLVDENPWLTERQFLNALSFCMLLPGPEAMQLATYAGWRLHGGLGGIMAGLLFVIPGAAVIFALGAAYVTYGNVPVVDTLFLGIKAAVLVIVLDALRKVSQRALTHRSHWIIAALAFTGIFFLAVPFPLIVVVAGIFGAVFSRSVPPSQPVPVTFTGTISPPRTLRTIVIGAALWIAPIIIIDAISDTSLLAEIGLFFSKLAVVTFGGAYAVLAYMAQDVVLQFGWLTADEMMDSLGLAETTPGPLILVTQFVGFIAGYREGGYGLAFAAASLTLWVTFVPCFIWILAGAPYLDWIANQPRLTDALHAITAAVVGVILNLSVWFGLHVLFGTVTQTGTGPLTLWIPDAATIDWRAVVLSILCAGLLLWRHVGLGWVLIASALASLGLTALS